MSNQTELVTAKVTTPQPSVNRSWRLWLSGLAILAGVAGLGFRIWVTLMGVPSLNSDEAIFGITALHILDGKPIPVFMYGQHYMGTLESFVSAPMIWLLGPETFALRTSTLLFYTLFLVAMYFLTYKVYSHGMALLTVVLLALGADRVIKDQLIADGSAELAAMSAALMLLAAVIGSRGIGRFGQLTLAWGFLAGVALWDHMLVLPFLVTSLCLLGWAISRDQRRLASITALTGFIVGNAPMLIHNLTSPLSENSLSVLLRYNSVGSEAPILERLHGGVLLGVPLATGICSPNACDAWQSAWGVLYLGLIAVGGYLAIRGLSRATSAEHAIERTRLALLASALLTVLLYSRTPSAADTPYESVRYLSLLLVSTPAVVWPLWRLATLGRSLPKRAVRALPLAALTIAMLAATAGFIAQVPRYAEDTRQHEQLAQALRSMGITQFYTVYWTCNRLVYSTHERAICAVLEEDLRPGFNRYQPYADVVTAANRVAYVAPEGSAFDRNVSAHLRRLAVTAQITTVAGYRIYIPERAAHPSR